MALSFGMALAVDTHLNLEMFLQNNILKLSHLLKKMISYHT